PRAANLGGIVRDPRPDSSAAARPQVPIDVLDHDHGRVDDDSEVHRAERDQVGGRAGETIPQNAAISASGMFTAATAAARAWPRNSQSTSVTSSMPTRRFSMTVWVVIFIRRSRA